MKLSWIEKERFYHEVAQYTKSGIALQEALQSMVETGDSGRSKNMARRLLKQSANGDSIYATFAHQKDAFSELELALLEAAEQSGRLEQCFRYLAEYFQSLHDARSEVVRRAMYPLFVLHLAVFLVPLPKLLTTGLLVYFMQTVGVLAVIYAIAIMVGFIVVTLLKLGGGSAGADVLLRMVPLFGKVRAYGSYSRFCMALEMQVQAGIPLLQAMPVAGRASQSGQILRVALASVKRIDNGETLADALGAPGPLPANIIRALHLGQTAGTLDEELSRWGKFYLDATLTRIRVLSDWLPKIMYFMIVGYVAFRILSAAKEGADAAMKTMDEMFQ